MDVLGWRPRQTIQPSDGHQESPSCNLILNSHPFLDIFSLLLALWLAAIHKDYEATLFYSHVLYYSTFMNPNEGWVKAEQGILQNCMVAPAVSCLVSHELCTEPWCCCTPWTVLLPFTAPCLEAQSISSWEELPAPSNPCGWEQHPSAPWHLVA